MKHTFGSRLLAVFLALSLLFTLIPAALAAEPEEGGGSTPTLTGVSLSQSNLTLTVGQEATLTAALQMSDGSTPQPGDYTVLWSVKDGRTDEVSVMPTGENSLSAVIKGVKTAETTQDKEVSVSVTVTLKGAAVGQTASCQVVVVPDEPAGVTVTPKTLELSPTETATNHTGQLNARVTPEGVSPSVAWQSADTGIATVSTSGLVTAVATGETTVTATSDTGHQDSCVVTVQGVLLDKDQKQTLTGDGMRVGDTFTLKSKVYGASLQDKDLVWSSSDSEIIQVDQGYLYALSEGTATVTVKVSGTSYTDSVIIVVKKATADVIRTSAKTGEPLSFSSLVSQLQAQSTSVLRMSLSYVSGLSVDTSAGTLYYRYASEGDTGTGIGTGESYYVTPGTGQLDLSQITFVPKADFEGTAVIHYTGYASGTKFFQGTIEVSVALEKDVTYSAAGGKAVQFSAADFNLVCKNRTGRDLSYVTFSLPDSSRGTLYYNYLSAQNPGTAVSVDGEYKYTGSPNLSEVYFIPASGTTGEVVFPYTAWDVNGTSYRGRVTIQVTAAAASGDITYSIAQNGRVTFDDTDFNTLSRNLTGYNLDRVRFTLPPASQGTLYYGYNSLGSYSSLVSEERDYYRSAYPYLDGITFVAKEGYAGTVSIPFTAWDTNGNRFYGEVGISVAARGSGTLRYAVFQGGEVSFDDSDFNDLSMDLTGSSLRYVRFTLPSSSQGTLYYRYTSSGSYSSKVSETQSYYRSSSPYLDDVSFVASGTYSGVVSIPFTGWSIGGQVFSGTVEIDVDSTPNPLVYQVAGGNMLTFQDEDFNSYCRLATGQSLNYVRFNLPASSQGTLYYDYRSSSSYDSKVTAYRSYYFSSSPYLDRVSFVPNSTYAGTFSLSFTGWSTGGRQFSGTVNITVTQGQMGSITYSTAYRPVTFQASDFISICAQRGRGTLVSVKFTGADNIQGGHLYYRYGGIRSASSEVRTGTAYYPSASPSLSEISFVPWVGYQGTVYLTYTATDSRGDTYQGTVRIQVTPNTTSNYFSDMGNYGWAVSAVDFLYENGVVSGTGGGRYAPTDPITRGNFLVMLDQAFGFPSASGHSFSDVPENAYYAQAIQRGYALGVVSGYPDGTFHPNEPITREAAAAMLYQAMRASGWSIGTPNESVLYGYSDWQSVSSYARGPLSVLVQNGLISGDTQGRLLPRQTMTRAEMAVVLAKSLTL